MYTIIIIIIIHKELIKIHERFVSLKIVKQNQIRSRLKNSHSSSPRFFRNKTAENSNRIRRITRDSHRSEVKFRYTGNFPNNPASACITSVKLQTIRRNSVGKHVGKRAQAALGDRPAENHGTRYQGCLIKDHVVSSVCTVKWKRTISSPWGYKGGGILYLVDRIASTRYISNVLS